MYYWIMWSIMMFLLILAQGYAFDILVNAYEDLHNNNSYQFLILPLLLNSFISLSIGFFIGKTLNVSIKKKDF